MNTYPKDSVKKPEKTSVFVTKLHQKPISITVGGGDLEIRMELSDFLSAAITEIGNPTLTVTKAQLEKNLTVAFNKVIEQMKKETAREG